MKRKKKRRRRRIPVPPQPKLEEDDSIRAPYEDDQGEPRGMARAVATFDECLRRPAVRYPLQEIDKLVRVKDKSGKA